MDDGAFVTFYDGDFFYSTVNDRGILVWDDDDNHFIKTDAYYPHISIYKKPDSSATPTEYTNYGLQDVTVKKSGDSSVYTQTFPAKSGTFAMTTDIPTFHIGTSDPASSLGNNGDIYLKISS